MVTLAISVLVTYLSIHFNLGYNVDLTLLSIAIVFHLFSIFAEPSATGKSLATSQPVSAALRRFIFIFKRAYPFC